MDDVHQYEVAAVNESSLIHVIRAHKFVNGALHSGRFISDQPSKKVESKKWERPRFRVQAPRAKQVAEQGMNCQHKD